MEINLKGKATLKRQKGLGILNSWLLWVYRWKLNGVMGLIKNLKENGVNYKSYVGDCWTGRRTWGRIVDKNELMLIYPSKCNFLLQRCKLLLQWCKFLLQWCEFQLQICTFLLQRCKLLPQRCKLLLQRCKLLHQKWERFYSVLSKIISCTWLSK